MYAKETAVYSFMKIFFARKTYSMSDGVTKKAIYRAPLELEQKNEAPNGLC